jgi:mono/diheme cytochrome c family protein
MERRIICAAVTRPTVLACAGALGLAALGAGCAQGEIEVPESQRAERQGAQLFYERCSGCHTIDAANSFGSKPTGQLQPGERTNGPNFNIRRVGREDVLFAIRNGGFSGAIMPANIVVGEDAERVADFLDRYSGRDPSNDETQPGVGNQP